MSIDRYIEFNPTIVALDVLLKDAIALFAGKQIDYILVVDIRLAGIVTKGDILKAISVGIDINNAAIDRVMTQPVITRLRSQCQDIQSVWSCLQQHSIDYLPILDSEENLIGVVNANRLKHWLKGEPKRLESDRAIGYLDREEDLKQTDNGSDKLVKAERQSEIIADKIPVGVFQTDTEGNCLFVNSRWRKLTGLSTSEALGTGWTKALHPEDYQKVFSHWNECTKTGQEFTLKHRFKRPNNEIAWVFSSAVVNYRRGEPIGYIGIVTDITEEQIALEKRKQIELQLQQERDFSEAIVNTVGALVAVLDRQGTIINFNNICEQITGYTLKEIRGIPVWDFLIPPEEKTTIKAVFKHLLAGQILNQYENYWIAKDGGKNLISWTNTALFDAEGNIEYIIATGIDITEQRKVWNKLELQYRQTKLLAEITRKIRMTIELKEILQTAVTEVQHLLACDRVLIVKIKSNNTVLPISESILPNFSSMLGYELADPLLTGKYLAQYRLGKVLAIDNLATASISQNIKQLLNRFQIQAKLVVPILCQTELKGLLVAHQCHHPRRWRNHEVQLLNQLADQIGVALSQAQLLNYSENLVSERTKELTATNKLLQSEIAEREQTERDLRENQQKLAGILDNADEAIISIDERQQIQLFNQGAEKIFGYQADEIIGQSLDLLLPKVFQEVHRHHLNQFGKSSEQLRKMARSSNVYGRRKNGSEFPAEASVAKLQTKSGMLFTVMLKDVTESREAKAKLQASKALLAKAERIAKIGSWEYDHEINKRSWSEELFHILGFDKNRPLPPYHKILERVYPEDFLLVTNTLHAGHREGKSWEITYRLMLPDGKLKYIESRGEPTLDSEGKVLRVLETIMDVSERQAALRDRLQAEKSLQRSEEQLRLITDALPVLIAYIDDRQRYHYNNHTYEIWYGKPRSSLQGRSIEETVGESNYQKMQPYIEIALSGKPVSFENQRISENGNIYWMNATYIPDFDSDGEVKGFFSMMEDITDRKVVEQMKSEFVSIASHEMRTPLTSIHGVIKLICAGRLGELSESGTKMANMALRNSDRLVHLINDILDLERMESGIDSLEKQKCDSAELIQQAMDTVRSIANEQQVKLKTDFQSIEFWADRDRIVQTLTNFMSNAIKFSQINSKVEIKSGLKDNNVTFTVKDWGRGIPTDKLQTIFERFAQVDASDSREKGGSGLGLSICRYIIEQHGGKIWVESIYGEGSNFCFSIPQHS